MPLGFFPGRAARLAAGLVLLAGAAAAEPALPGGRSVLGQGWMFSNDALGDGKDRWRSVSLSWGVVTGPEWTGVLPDRRDVLLEYRLLLEAIAPADLVAPDPADRRYAGILSVGLHSQFALGAAEVRMGGEVVTVGPQSGIGRLHEAMHDLLGLDRIDTSTHAIEGGIYPTVSAEIGWPRPLGRAAVLRPFVDARLGDEDFLRIGADLALGAVDAGALWLRDPVTGHRHVAVPGPGRPTGVFGVLGGDVALLADSAWMPDGGAVQAEDHRVRLRLGLGHAGPRFDAFYGLTWMSREFTTQEDEQLVGSVSLRMNF